MFSLLYIKYSPRPRAPSSAGNKQQTAQLAYDATSLSTHRARKCVAIMGISYRCTSAVLLVTLGLLSESRAFVLCGTAVLRSSTRTANMLASISSDTCSTRAARVGGRRQVALMMSEMAEDYPSDTGDDRFSTGGKLGRYLRQRKRELTYVPALLLLLCCCRSIYTRRYTSSCSCYCCASPNFSSW